jgi:hypothetical protein
MECEKPKQAVAVFRKMMEDMELINPIAGNREKEIDVLSHSVNPVRLKNNPVKLAPQTIKLLYRAILK